MKVKEARDLAAALIRAADAAEAAGKDEFEFIDELLALDDAARAELEAAIARSAQG